MQCEAERAKKKRVKGETFRSTSEELPIVRQHIQALNDRIATAPSDQARRSRQATLRKWQSKEKELLEELRDEQERTSL